MMIDALWQGFVTGFWLSLSFGPIFFLLLQTSIQKGIRQAFALDLGVFLSDLFYIIIAFFGASMVLAKYDIWIGLIGGGVLIVFGIAPFFNKAAKPIPENLDAIDPEMLPHVSARGEMIVNRLHLPKLIVKGFLVNLFNPSVLIIWFGAAAWAFKTFGGKTLPVIFYFAVTLITYFGIDVLKIYLALKLKHFINPKAMAIVHKISGLIIMVFGVYLIMNSLDSK